MTARLNPYLSFRDNAREAITFYQSVFGGDLNISTFADFQASEDPADADKVMHSQLDAPNGMTLMAADTPHSMEITAGTNYSVSLSGDEEAALQGYWDKLSDGATIAQPLEKAPWGDSFGMLVDKFGVSWLVNISGAPEGAPS
ncbi:VOC family protein [Glaciibacter sp. 2TAF33]|uniref:VOC family protein n=1 Tax=Glaciibacter sp. 2TAF33 TaxID=3233015 RepID=UPI003F91EA76